MTQVSRPILFNCFFLTALFFLYSCGEKPATDPCCTFTELPADAKVKDGQGVLQVDGGTAAYFYVFDESGKQVGYELLNKTLSLDPGKYQIKVNSSIYPLKMEAGRLAKCATGTLIVKGNTPEYYYVMDSVNNQLSYDLLGKATSFFPSSLKVKVNNTETPADVNINKITEIVTGTLVVRGSTNEYYYVLDGMNKQLNYNMLEKPLAFLPGTYPVKVNNSSMKADVVAGQLIALVTGTLLVSGLTNEYYYVLDSLGNSLNYQSLNKSLAFFPGNLEIKLNNTHLKAKVVKGEISEFVTGSLMLTGNGSDYYYVFNQSGNQLNYNSLNKSLSFFPSEYTVKLGQNSRKATVSPGQLTSITEFK